MPKSHFQLATKTCNAKRLTSAFSESKSLPKPREGPAHSQIRSLQTALATGYISWNQSHLVEDEPTGTGRQQRAPQPSPCHEICIVESGLNQSEHAAGCPRFSAQAKQLLPRDLSWNRKSSIIEDESPRPNSPSPLRRLEPCHGICIVESGPSHY